MTPALSLIVPCFNEAPHLRESVATLLQTLRESALDCEVVFVDDASQDATVQILEEICARDGSCRFLSHEQNRGRGAAFKTGFAATSGKVTGFLDIDLEVHPLYIPALVNLIEREGYDVATGLRFYRVNETRAILRLVISVGYRWLTNAILGFRIKDSETGCKFFRRDTASDVVAQSADDGWFWDTEVMARSVLANLAIVEMPVVFLRCPEKPSSVRIVRDSWRQLVELIRFRITVGSCRSGVRRSEAPADC